MAETKMDWKNDNGEHFEKHASEILLPIYPWLMRDLCDAINRPVTGSLLLEIGCGPGFMLQQFATAHPARLVGIDKSSGMLQKAAGSGRGTQAELIQADVSALPFAEASFDTVFSRGSVFFWPDLELALREIKRCLKPGGCAFIGGGYGLSTPQEIIDAIRTYYADRTRDGIPRLDPDRLLALALTIGGNGRILQARRRGFWLYWQP